MDVTNPYEFIGFGAMDVTKPYEFIRFGAMDIPHIHLSGPREDGRATRRRGGGTGHVLELHYVMQSR